MLSRAQFYEHLWAFDVDYVSEADFKLLERCGAEFVDRRAFVRRYRILSLDGFLAPAQKSAAEYASATPGPAAFNRAEIFRLIEPLSSDDKMRVAGVLACAVRRGEDLHWGRLQVSPADARLALQFDAERRRSQLGAKAAMNAVELFNQAQVQAVAEAMTVDNPWTLQKYVGTPYDPTLKPPADDPPVAAPSGLRRVVALPADAPLPAELSAILAVGWGIQLPGQPARANPRVVEVPSDWIVKESGCDTSLFDPEGVERVMIRMGDPDRPDEVKVYDPSAPLFF